MNVGPLIQSVKACHPDDRLNTAAQIMWENDCSSVPVVDAEGTVVGMVTDRDVCVAAYTQGRPLAALPVSSAMSKTVYTCKPGDSLAAAEEMLRAHKVRRVPVVDAAGHLVGILSLNDIAREAAHERASKKKEARFEEVAGTLATICEPRSSRGLQVAA